MSETVELLFFDTFAHDNTEEINLDLVQFPKPVNITEVRIIPLGARVQADFPGGVRLGATNPSQFQIEFFVNDLGKPGASTFESLGGFEYIQNGCINLDCLPEETTVRKIPTDGLVLRGWYTTITLAVYGTLTNNITEQLIQPVNNNNPTLSTQQSNTIVDAQQQVIPAASVVEADWPPVPVDTIPPVPIEYSHTTATYQPPPSYNTAASSESYTQEYPEYYNDVPKDPRSYHHTPETDWETAAKGGRPRTTSDQIDRDRERVGERNYQKSDTGERTTVDSHSRTSEPDRRGDRDREKNNYSRSRSHDRTERPAAREYSRDRGGATTSDWDQDRGSSSDYRDWDRGDRGRGDRSYNKHNDDTVGTATTTTISSSYRRSYNRSDDRDESTRKRPRTPPIQSPPKRPHTPLTTADNNNHHHHHHHHHHHQKEHQVSSSCDVDGNFSENEEVNEQQQKTVGKKVIDDLGLMKDTTVDRLHGGVAVAVIEEPGQVVAAGATTSAGIDVAEEEFEPILSDEDILDDNDNNGHYHQDIMMDYDYGAYTNNDDLIKLFLPGVTELKKYSRNNDDENLRITIGIVDDYFKSSITKYVLDDFARLNNEIKEEFIHLCEKLINQFGSIENFCCIMKLANKSFSLLLDEELLSNQIRCIVQTVIDWLKIALNYQMANLQDQPAYKIRHIKCGVRLAEFCCNSLAFIQILWCRNDFNIHSELLTLYEQEFMALSIKLMILKALDTYLLHKYAIEKFLTTTTTFSNNKIISNGFHDANDNDSIKNNNTGNSGYKMLVENLRDNPSVRLKFALNSILKKLNLFEALRKIFAILVDLNDNIALTNDQVDLIAKCLQQILTDCLNSQSSLIFSQPKRFLPVAAQFEIPCRRNNDKNVVIIFFEMFNLLQCFLVLLTHPSTFNVPQIKTSIYEILSELLNDSDGLEYLSSNCDTLNVLLKCLLLRPESSLLSSGGDDNNINNQIVIDSVSVEIKSHNLALEIAYKIQTLYHIECLKNYAKILNYDYDDPLIVDNLHGLYCLTFSTIGKISLGQVLGMQDNLHSLLQFFDSFSTHNNDSNNLIGSKTKKSPGLAYIVDIIAFAIINVSNVPMLMKYAKNLLQLINQQYCLELFEDSVQAKLLNEIQPYLMPFENYSNNNNNSLNSSQSVLLNYDNIAGFVDIIKNVLDNNVAGTTTFPGQLITSLRILQYLGVPAKYSNQSLHQQQQHEEEDQQMTTMTSSSYIELKYKHVILQLFSLDGVAILTKLLSQICDYFTQPSLHSSIFVSTRGLIICNVLYPCVELLAQMLTLVIHCRNINYNDLTTIPILLQTYNLLNSFPVTSGAYLLTRDIRKIIIDTLLVYTQPVSEEIHEKDSLNKTLWSQMCGEVIKFIMSAPFNFISGLLIFSELLPLPLPIQTKDDLTVGERTWAINLRKLWSAHLHPHTITIQQELIGKLCTTSNQQLLNLLRRVCVQLADLAANSATIIAKGILDAVCDALAVGTTTTTTILIGDDVNNKIGICCNSNVARLLNFLACLVTHSTIKCAVLNLIHNNINGDTITTNNNNSNSNEKYSTLITRTFTQILLLSHRNTTNLTHIIQSQECILSIIQSFCDAEGTLLIQQQYNSIQLKKIKSSEVYLSNALPTKENLLIFITTILDHLMIDAISFVTCLPIVRTFLLLTEHDYGFYHLRDCLLNNNKKATGGVVLFACLLNKSVKDFAKDNAECLAMLSTLLEFLVQVSVVPLEDVDDDSQIVYMPRTMKLSLVEIQGLVGWTGSSGGGGDDKHPLLRLEEILKKIVEEDNTFESLLDGVNAVIKLLSSDVSTSSESSKEIYIEPILPDPEPLLVQFAGRTIFSSADVCDERLTIRYWLSVPNEEGDNDIENITCDLMEIARQNLPPEFNLIKEIEKLCRISPSETLIDVDKAIKLNKDHKVKMKKPFITPMRARGFPRTIQQRSDLFRSRPPNTSRPPSLHVDDFVALETCGAQPTGPTGYNKISRELLASTRISTRGTRGRTFVASERTVQCRQLSWWGSGLGRGPY